MVVVPVTVKDGGVNVKGIRSRYVLSSGRTEFRTQVYTASGCATMSIRLALQLNGSTYESCIMYAGRS